MRVLKRRPVELNRPEVFAKRDKLSSYLRRHQVKPYAQRVSPETNNLVPEDLLADWADANVRRRLQERDTWTARQLFTLWFETEVNRRMREEKWSGSAVIKHAKMARSTYYAWLDPNDESRPNLGTLERVCHRLGLSYGTALAILSWTPGDRGSGGLVYLEMEKKKRRAESLMSARERRGVLSPELRAAFESQLESIERNMRQMMDDLIERIEEDFDTTDGQAPGGTSNE
jgi:hypothetical protein